MICGCKPSKYKEILIEKTIQLLMFRKIVTKLDELLSVFYKSPTDLNRLQFSIQFGNFRSKYLIDIDIFFVPTTPGCQTDESRELSRHS